MSVGNIINQPPLLVGLKLIQVVEGNKGVDHKHTTRQSNANRWVIALASMGTWTFSSSNEDHYCSCYYQSTVQIGLQALNAFPELFICSLGPQQA